MRRITLTVVIALTHLFGFSQACPSVAAGTVLIQTGLTSYSLTVNFDANGQKHFQAYIYNGPVAPQNLIQTECLPVQNEGSITLNFSSPGTPIIVLVPGTGNCNNGNGNSCPSAAVTINVSTGGPLPVIMTSFFAKRENNVVKLNWQTRSEINTKEFIIQKNTGNGFVDIKTVPASNRVTGSIYNETDNNISRTNSMYRLKMVDADGKFGFSETRTVKGTGVVSDINIYPNPSTGNAKVTVSDISEPTDVQLIDNSGRILKTVSMNNTNTVDLLNLPGGMYLVRIVNKTTGVAENRKLTVVKN